MADIRRIQSDLSSFKTLHEDIKILREEVQGVQNSVESCHMDVAAFGKRINTLEKRLEKVENLETEVTYLRKEVRIFADELNKRDQWARLQNLEIKGIPHRNDENLMNIIKKISNVNNINISESDVEFVTRVATNGNRPDMTKPIILKLTNRSLKNQFLQAVKARKGLTTADIGFAGTPKNIYVNDHLTKVNKNLFFRARVLAKERGFQYVWLKNCLIFARRNSTSPPIIISKEEDLKKMEVQRNFSPLPGSDAGDPRPSQS